MSNIQKKTETVAALNATMLSTDVTDIRTFAFDVSGTFVATLAVQVSGDGVTWRTITSATLVNLVTGASTATATAPGYYAIDVSSVNNVRVIASAYTSGTAQGISSVTSTGNLSPVSNTASPATVTANAGTPLPGTTYNLITAATTNAASVKATAGNLFELTISNPTATAAYVKLYNKASAPTVGTDVPVLTIPVPATAAGVGLVQLNLGNLGKRFATGIALAVTAAAASTDTAATVAGIQVNGTYN